MMELYAIAVIALIAAGALAAALILFALGRRRCLALAARR